MAESVLHNRRSFLKSAAVAGVAAAAYHETENKLKRICLEIREIETGMNEALAQSDDDIPQETQDRYQALTDMAASLPSESFSDVAAKILAGTNKSADWISPELLASAWKDAERLLKLTA